VFNPEDTATRQIYSGQLINGQFKYNDNYTNTDQAPVFTA
jgi:hypothetical protein